MPARLISIVGARPQFVKVAAVSRALAAIPSLEPLLLHTGQHFDREMSDVFFSELGIPAPDWQLGIHGGGHGEMTGRMLAALEPILRQAAPAAVIVYGDTNSTLAGALAAAKLDIPIAHVEAGLRSFDRRMPEEINRVVADVLSSVLFCPTQGAVANLAREGITTGVEMVGDVMYDAVLHAAKADKKDGGIVARLGLARGAYHVATVHRAGNTDDPVRLAEIIAYLIEIGRSAPVIFPIHPRTRAELQRLGRSLDGLMVIEPLGFFDMQQLIGQAKSVITDSGGLQKEAYFHRVPCITLRDETEWVETIEAGWNRLWRGPDYLPRRLIADYGDGHAAAKIARILADRLS